jgi:hypothetical protein
MDKSEVMYVKLPFSKRFVNQELGMNAFRLNFMGKLGPKGSGSCSVYSG